MSKKTCLYILPLYFASLFFPATAQVVNDTLLSMDEAINRALRNNTDISVAFKEVEAAKNEATIWNAGFFPSISADGSHKKESKDTRMEFAGNEFPDIDVKNAKSQTTNASIGLNYNLFGGLEKYYNYRSLRRDQTIAEVQARLTMENQLLELINIYLETSNLEQEVLVNERAIELSADRLIRVEEQYELGAVSRLEFLQARVDLNTDSINYAESETNLLNSKRRLTTQMGIPPETNFTVESLFPINTRIDLDSILNLAFENNSQLRLRELQKENADLQERLAYANYLPRLNFNLQYAYFKSTSEAGFVQAQRTKGPEGTFSLSFDIFNGFQQRTLRQNAQIQIEANKERVDQAKEQVERDVKIAYENYQKSLNVLKLMADDVEVAEMSYERAFEAYRTGAINGYELRQAQLNYLQALLRRHRILTQAKQAEVQLYQLAGVLVN